MTSTLTLCPSITDLPLSTLLKVLFAADQADRLGRCDHDLLCIPGLELPYLDLLVYAGPGVSTDSPVDPENRPAGILLEPRPDHCRGLSLPLDLDHVAADEPESPHHLDAHACDPASRVFPGSLTHHDLHRIFWYHNNRLSLCLPMVSAAYNIKMFVRAEAMQKIPECRRSPEMFSLFPVSEPHNTLFGDHRIERHIVLVCRDGIDLLAGKSDPDLLYPGIAGEEAVVVTRTVTEPVA